jgi:hypothetical protein
MYSTRGYPIDLDLRRAHRARRDTRGFPTLRAFATYLRSGRFGQRSAFALHSE